MGGSRGLLACVVLATTAAGAACAPALGASAGSDRTSLSYKASDGERNRVVLTWEGATVLVRDPGAALVLGCIPVGLNDVRCAAPSGDARAGVTGCVVCTALIATGDGDDSAQVLHVPASGLTVTLDGGPGDDTLSSDAAAGTVAGGAGDDTLSGHLLDGGPGADTTNASDSADTTTYAGRSEPIRVTLDDVANDGAAGEGDDVRTQNVTGGEGDDVLIGDGAANKLGSSTGGNDAISGAGGPDTLIGGPGQDTLDGGPGDDTVLSFLNAHGIVDDVTCGSGEDTAQVSRFDRVALDCEHVYLGGTPVPRLQIAGAERVRARGGVLRLAVTAQPEEQGFEPARGPAAPAGPAITARATLQALRGKPGGVLARARLASFAAPGTARVALRLTARARRELARRGRIRMRVTVTARDADGNESITRRVLLVRP